ncbi:Transglutaminase-like superfamily protein [Poriferisphaera corsica]|uniref:Transglutaminase-like superfamily protein n=1 Tax=Poriferisphaera corsica TaxID=2528020 RepID=A0A517YRC2_9BACT|nr:transglutaminase-like domain-containing protein [Poriferisphaera corsica]QDU32783.1 Transglutaminase-like superfamily protein [Poriferisphaera corsica]
MRMKLGRWFVGLMCVLMVGAVSGVVRAQNVRPNEMGDVQEEQWYVLMLGGQRAGWTQARRGEDDGLVRSDVKMNLKIKRGAIELEIDMLQVSWETSGGEPRRAYSEMNMGGGSGLKAAYKMGEDGVIQTTWQLGKPVEKAFPELPTDVLGLAASEKVIAEKLKAGEDEFSIKTADLSLGVTVVEAKFKKVGEKVIEVYGKKAPAIEWEVKLSNLPSITAKQYTDERGRVLRMMVPMGGGLDVEMVAADKATAMMDLEAPEVMAETLIKPMAGSVKGDIRSSRQAVYELSFKRGKDVDLKMPRTGTQKVIWGSSKKARVVVNLDEANNPEADLPAEDDLASTQMLRWDDEVVQSLIRRALGDDMGQGMSDREKASKLRRFVNAYIDEKSLAVGMATAAEVARTKEGDCTEHAALLAAMLRGAAIPSRVVNGLMFVDEFMGYERVLGYHAWTMAWIEEEDGGRWVDFDAVLSGNEDYDAGHIAMTVSSMRDDQMQNDLVGLVPMMGNVKVKVVRLR